MRGWQGYTCAAQRKEVQAPPFSVLHTCILATPARVLPVFALIICLPKLAFNFECYTVRIGISTS